MPSIHSKECVESQALTHDGEIQYVLYPNIPMSVMYFDPIALRYMSISRIMLSNK